VKKKINVEVFVSPNCDKCASAVALVTSLIEEPNIQWRKVDVVAELDYAVELGVRATPSIAINGQLIFTGLPAKNKLWHAMTREMKS